MMTPSLCSTVMFTFTFHSMFPKRICNGIVRNLAGQPVLSYGRASAGSCVPSRVQMESTGQRMFSSDPLTAQPVPKKGPPKNFCATPFQYHEEMLLRIESLTHMGWGVGRVKLENYPTTIDLKEETGSEVQGDKDQRQWVVFVPGVVEGELVRVRIFRNRNNYSEADLMEIVEPSPERVDPVCPIAGICGGCQYQHMSIRAQRQWKRQHVEEVFSQQKIRGFEPGSDTWVVQETLGTPEVFGYRTKITPHYDAPRNAGGGRYKYMAIGFQKAANRQLVDVPECPIATPAINQKYSQVRQDLTSQAEQGIVKRRKSSKGGRILGATLLFRQADPDVPHGPPVVATDYQEYITTTVSGLKFRYKAGNFFQNNDYVLPLMVDAVREAVSAPIRSTGKAPSFLIDCYCGSGLFALSLARDVNVCAGIELNPLAVEEAKANAELNDITNCHFMASSAEAIFSASTPLSVEGVSVRREDEGLHVQDFPRDQTVVIVDPPRKGCSEEFLQQLYEYGPQRIAYMSCGPATQARDAKGIVEIGGYDIVSIQPIDLFPQTKHIECLVVFEKRT
eukprot:Nitzschia sp. Nitz4//scaffold6_size259037//171702//173474//NITZ4_001093-RA/size259037-augustus-gene-0.326-mRNA-1//-1//CDS//3329556950//3836//frame0